MNKYPNLIIRFNLIALIAIITSCTTLKNHSPQDNFWFGKIAINDPVKSQNYSFNFELIGNQDKGQLTLSTIVGGNFASINWQPNIAYLNDGKQTKHFNHINELISQTLAINITITDIFNSLQGKALNSKQWNTDFDPQRPGKISLTETNSTNPIKIKIIYKQNLPIKNDLAT